VVPLVILVLGAGAAVVYVKRRRNRPSPWHSVVSLLL